MINDRRRMLNFLGIAQGAGKIISGENLLLRAIQTHRIKFMVLASNAGKATQKKFLNKARFYQISFNNDFAKETLSHAIGRNRSVVGVTDDGFANRLIELNQKIKGQ